MKVRFNRFERLAGIFVAAAMGTCFAALIGVAVKNGWFSSKVSYKVFIESADGVRPGTDVQIAGLRVGAVTHVELLADQRILVNFEILEKFKERVRADSHVQMFRPFILAEKVLEVSVGSEAAAQLSPGSELTVVAGMDVMDLLSGKKMASLINSFDHLAESLRIVATAFSDPKRSKALVQMFDRLGPLVNNLNKMSIEFSKVASAANKEQRVETIISNLAAVSVELEKALPAFREEVPDLGRQMGQIVTNLNILTTEFQKLTPAIAILAPQLPRTTTKAVEALDEAVVLLKALQKSFLFRGGVKEVLQEQEQNRQPAGLEK